MTIAGDAPFAPARWSRYATRSVSCPSPFEPERFMEWLVAFGKREPGHVLYPSCDDLAWLFAHHADELKPYFRMYQPPAATVLDLLDKKALSLRCAEVGVPIPRTLFPGNVSDAWALATQVGFPLIMKPRTQILLRTRKKGHIVEDQSEFTDRYREFITDNTPHRLARAVLPDVEHPMLQALVPAAAGATYSLSGFIARDHRHMVVRAAMKVLQRPRRVGVGVCFEDVDVDEAALQGVMRLCEAVGYFGVFEAEFLPNQGTLQLVDFNPRFYGQMGFEAARELDLPYLVWLGAVGESGKLAEAMSHASEWESGRGYVYCDRFYLSTLLFLQRLSGSMSTAERTRWREWLDAPTQRSKAFDPFESPGDPWPALVSKLREIGTAARHPRAFYRKVVVGGATALVEITPQLSAFI